jgi:hypothetical protein
MDENMRPTMILGKVDSVGNPVMMGINGKPCDWNQTKALMAAQMTDADRERLAATVRQKQQEAVAAARRAQAAAPQPNLDEVRALQTNACLKTTDGVYVLVNESGQPINYAGEPCAVTRQQYEKAGQLMITARKWDKIVAAEYSKPTCSAGPPIAHSPSPEDFGWVKVDRGEKGTLSRDMYNKDAITYSGFGEGMGPIVKSKDTNGQVIEGLFETSDGMGPKHYFMQEREQRGRYIVLTTGMVEVKGGSFSVKSR